MTKDEVLALIEADIEATEKALLFWNRQKQLKLDEPFDDIVFDYVRRLETTMGQLLHARDMVTDA